MDTQLAGEAHRCFEEEELLDLAAGKVDKEVAWERLAEVERCPDCAYVLAEAGQAVARDADDPEEPSPLIPSTPAFRAGDVLGNRFRIVRAIGRGGMGDVYEAVDSELGERLALKTMRADIAHQTQSVRRLKQEIRLARRVVHPHVCRVLEFGRDDTAVGTCYFLTMELLSGELLSDRLRRFGRLSVADALCIAEQLCAGLQAIHAEGILHRDIKTNNVMICGLDDPQAATTGTRERAVLLDFGIARTLEPDDAPLTTRGVIGTPDYMAPEHLKGEELTPAADVYAFGVVLFELLAGQLPFAANGSIARLLKRLESCPPRPGAWVPDVPPAVDDLVMWCLERDPASRPRSADELRAAIAGLRAGASTAPPRAHEQHAAVTGKATPVAEEPAEPPGTARRVTPFVVLALLLVGVLAWTQWAAWSPNRTSADSAAAAVRVPPLPVERPIALPSRDVPSPAQDDVPLPAHDAEPRALTPEPGTPQGVDSEQPRPEADLAARAARQSRRKQKAQRTRAAKAREAAPVSAPPEAPQCDPPYYYNSKGLRVYRKDCL